MYTTAELFIMAFSPPYGDGTYAEPYEEVRTRFRPLTGMVHFKILASQYNLGFRPLMGMVH